MADKITVRDFADAKAKQRRLTMLTAYSHFEARLVDGAGVDAVLVGDSLGMVVKGEPNTLSVTLDEAIHHAKCVRRGVRRALLVLDLPFASYRVSREQTRRDVIRAVQEAGVEAVKIEGGIQVAETIRDIVDLGVPVMGHVGMLPSYVHEFGFGLQGREASGMRRILDDAQAVEAAGAFSMVIENVPASLAATISRRAGIPTIGIGAGPDCDGQVLVLHDLLGLTPDHQPPFVRRYAELGALALDAIRAYCVDVREGGFPGPGETRDLDAAGKKALDALK